METTPRAYTASFPYKEFKLPSVIFSSTVPGVGYIMLFKHFDKKAVYISDIGSLPIQL